MAKAAKKQGQQPRTAAPVIVGTEEHKDRLTALADAVQAVRAGERTSPRTAKLLAMGVPKMAQKVIEEAAEVAIDAVRGEQLAVVNESVDLLYNLVVLWSAIGITPGDVWTEMDRRSGLLGMSEKLPKVIEEPEMALPVPPKLARKRG